MNAPHESRLVIGPYVEYKHIVGIVIGLMICPSIKTMADSVQRKYKMCLSKSYKI